MSPWKREHSSPHLSRSLSCPCSRKKHFLALVSSQGSPAGYPVPGGAGHPVASLEPLGGRAWQSPRCRLQTSQCLRSWGVRLPRGQPEGLYKGAIVIYSVREKQQNISHIFCFKRHRFREAVVSFSMVSPFTFSGMW